MPPEPIVRDSAGIDLSGRALSTTTVVASPATTAETIIAQLPAISARIPYMAGVILFGYCSFTVGTSGANARVRIRQTNVSGTVVGDTGDTTGGITAGNLCDINCNGFDPSPVAGQVYVLTLHVGSAAATSTVGFVSLIAIAV